MNKFLLKTVIIFKISLNVYTKENIIFDLSRI